MDEQEKQAVEELKGAVATLTQSVADLKDGLIDQETVEKVALEVVEKQAAANPGLVKQGFKPDDNGDANGTGGLTTQDGDVRSTNKIPLEGAERLQAIQSLRPKEVVRWTKNTKAPLADAEEIEEFQRVADGMAILSAICQSGRFKESGWPEDPRETRYFEDEFKPWVQAMDSVTAGEGDEWVPTLMSGSMIERITLQLRVAALFPTINMPSNPFEVPGRAISRSRLGTKVEETGDTGQGKFQLVTPGTRKVTMTAVKLGGRALVSKEFEEDAMVAVLPFIQDELTEFMAADLEDAIINGDSSNPHIDSDVTDFTDPSDPRTAWDGLRNLAAAAAKTDIANADPTVLNSLRANRTKMGKYGIALGDLVHITSIIGYMKLLSDTNVYTVDKYGAGATILSGELGRADGAPILVSEYVRQDLNATGVFDNVTTNRSIILTVNKRGYVIGQRRGLTVQVLRELYAESDQDAVVVSWRKAFTPWYPAASQFLVGLTYNVKAV